MVSNYNLYVASSRSIFSAWQNDYFPSTLLDHAVHLLAYSLKTWPQNKIPQIHMFLCFVLHYLILHCCWSRHKLIKNLKIHNIRKQGIESPPPFFLKLPRILAKYFHAFLYFNLLWQLWYCIYQDKDGGRTIKTLFSVLLWEIFSSFNIW